MFLITGARKEVCGAVVSGAQVVRRQMIAQLLNDCERGQPRGLRIARVLCDLDSTL